MSRKSIKHTIITGKSYDIDRRKYLKFKVNMIDWIEC